MMPDIKISIESESILKLPDFDLSTKSYNKPQIIRCCILIHHHCCECPFSLNYVLPRTIFHLTDEIHQAVSPTINHAEYDLIWCCIFFSMSVQLDRLASGGFQAKVEHSVYQQECWKAAMTRSCRHVGKIWQVGSIGFWFLLLSQMRVIKMKCAKLSYDSSMDQTVLNQ